MISGRIVLACSMVLVILMGSDLALAGPPKPGLVLWLDAENPASVTMDTAGMVRQWSDQSGRGNHARQPRSGAQPEYLIDGIGGKPALGFDGGDFLTLGQPDDLAFLPGRSHTIVAVYDLPKGNLGTIIARGGGGAEARACHLYLTPDKVGAIASGVRKEAPAGAGPGVVAQLCDGDRMDVQHNGHNCMTFRAGKVASDVDVLIGARRETADNLGVSWLLKGSLAEILVYDRALPPPELEQVYRHLNQKYGIEAVPLPSDPNKLAALLTSHRTGAELKAMAGRIGEIGDEAAPALESLLGSHRSAAPQLAELLALIAENNQLSNSLAVVAAGLLEHDDPFVHGPAEWAIAMKVGGDNNKQEIVWPRPDPPTWYRAWARYPADRRVEADWVRQALSRSLHRSGAAMLQDVDAMIRRVEAMRAAFSNDAEPARCEFVRQRLAGLRTLRGQMASQVETAPNLLASPRKLWIEGRRLLREVVMARPELDFQRLIFVSRYGPHTIRNITRAYQWKHKPGGDICILDGLRPDAPRTAVIDGRLGPGHVRGLDLWWDADRVVFGFARQPAWPPKIDTTDYTEEGEDACELRKTQEPTHIFEIRCDGSELRQRTDHGYWCDFEPTYCANGDIAFSSERCARSAECGRFEHDHTDVNLYVWSAATGDVVRLTDNKDVDRYPHSLDNGLIAFTRWEYQERHFMQVHSIWTARPDGTMADALYKQHMNAPCGLRDIRSIPGGSKLAAIATGHHTFAMGPVCVVDPRAGLNAEAGLRIVTPGVKPQEGAMAGSPVDEGGVPDRGGFYRQPWPLSERCFLVSYAYDRPNCTAHGGADSNGFGLYVIDSFGNKELVYRDPLLSCEFPIPLLRRCRPPLLPPSTEPARADAVCYISDVHEGLEGIPRGTVKYLRISQHIGWPLDEKHGAMPYIPANAYSKTFGFESWSPVRVLGEVPVEPDGSAHFVVPADTAVYFQALDERHMEIRRMRSMVSLQHGETRGCRGCHESDAKTPAVRYDGSLAALRRPPNVPAPPPWGAERMLGYEELVQPILDRHCIRCHGAENPDGELDFTAARATDGYYQSFRTLFGFLPGEKQRGRVLVSCSNRFDDARVTQPKQFGSHQSPLIRVLLEDKLHETEVSLTPIEWRTLVTWVDANAPYYNTFYNKRPADGSPPRRDFHPDL
ncbi:MAG: hypothetical protein GXY83_09070 [Rhodopirellula sp.]|nr:hypothetical protein [Rhodopirellula sp.]